MKRYAWINLCPSLGTGGPIKTFETARTFATVVENLEKVQTDFNRAMRASGCQPFHYLVTEIEYVGHAGRLQIQCLVTSDRIINVEEKHRASLVLNRPERRQETLL